MMLVMLSITISHIQSKIMSIELVVQDVQMQPELRTGNIISNESFEIQSIDFTILYLV